MEKEPELYNCKNCPEVPGRFCVRYGPGKRLIYSPRQIPEAGRRTYGVPASIKETINDCPFRPKIVERSDLEADVAS